MLKPSRIASRLLEHTVRRAEDQTLLGRLGRGEKPDSPATIALLAACTGAGLCALAGLLRRR
jgi:hypothetical protein